MNKKSVIFIVVSLLLGLIVGYCIGKVSISSKSKTTNEFNKDTSIVSNDGEKKKEATVKNLGEKIENDDFTMSFEKADFKEEIKWSTGSYSSRSVSIDPGKVALTISGKIKNLRGTEIQTSCFIGKITVDNKYTYDLKMETHNNGYSIEPLEEVEYDLLAQVPKEIKDSYNKVEIVFGYMNDYSIPTVTYINGAKQDVIDSLDNLYSITLTK